MTVYVNGEGQNTTNSAGIVDGSIVNADINSSAAIAATKISGTALVASTADAKGDLYVASAADTVGRLAVGANGTVPTANSGDTAGIGYAYPESNIPAVWREMTTVKALPARPHEMDTSFTMVDGQFRIAAIYLPFDATLTGIGWYQQTQGDTTADNENRLGLYTSDGTTLTLVASCADDGALWEGSGFQEKAFSSTYPAQAGLYFLGFLSNWSAAAVTPVMLSSSNDTAAVLPTNRKSGAASSNPFGTLGGQATLPLSVGFASITQSGIAPYMYVY